MSTGTQAFNTLLLGLFTALPALAQSHQGHDMDHATMDHSAMGHAVPNPDTRHAHGTAHAHPPGAPREPIAPVTEADRAAAFPVIDHRAMQHAPAVHRLLRVERLEQFDGGHGRGQAWEASGWIGGDIRRLWVRSKGEREAGRTQSSNLEVAYGHALSPWWDVQAGVRQDFRPAHSRTWAALGVQGLAPYTFETSAMLYAGSGGQVLAEAEIEYEILLTNRLILQPVIEATLAARDEPGRGLGRGLGKIEAGLRLRYEMTRRFAPYVGVSHERLFGDTADYQVAAGESARDTRWVAGVRLWF